MTFDCLEGVGADEAYNMVANQADQLGFCGFLAIEADRLGH